DQVGVGMARQPALPRDLDAGEHQRPSIGERVGIEADTDPQVAHANATWRRSRRSKTVIVRYPASCSSPTARPNSRPTPPGAWASGPSVTGTPRSCSFARSGGAG